MKKTRPLRIKTLDTCITTILVSSSYIILSLSPSLSLPVLPSPPPPSLSPSTSLPSSSIIKVDDSATVAEITKTVCNRIGITNPEEFFLCTESETAQMALRRLSAWICPLYASNTVQMYYMYVHLYTNISTFTCMYTMYVHVSLIIVHECCVDCSSIVNN